jgi:DNA-binding transcriptional LysR family regulator
MHMAAEYDRQPASMQAISLRQLRFFVALARIGHFGRAADSVAISQPALSAAIRHIEDHLGLKLFDRTTHRVALTVAGETLLPHALRLLTTAENAFSDMREVSSLAASTVRIGAIPSAVAAVASVLPGCERGVPGVIAHLGDGKSDDLIRGLRTGAYDLLVTVSTNADPEFETIALAEDEMLLLVRADHPLANEARLPWRALAGEEVVHFAGGSIGELSAAALQQNGVAPSLRYSVDQVDSLYGLVLGGLAVGVMPRLYTRPLDTTRLRLVPLMRPTVRRRVKLLFRPELKQEHARAHALAMRLSAELRRVLAG